MRTAVAARAFKAPFRPRGLFSGETSRGRFKYPARRRSSAEDHSPVVEEVWRQHESAFRLLQSGHNTGKVSHRLGAQKNVVIRDPADLLEVSI